MCWTSNLRLSRLVYLSCSAVHCFAIGSSSHEEVASNIGEWHWQKRDWKVSSDSAKDSEQTSLTSFDLEWQWHSQKRDWKVSSDITWRDDLLWSHGAIFNIVSVDMSWPFECIEQLKVKQCRKPASTGWKPWKTHQWNTFMIPARPMAARSLPVARAEVRTAALAAELLQLGVSGGLCLGLHED